MSYTSRLPAEAIDSALLLAQSIGRNVGIPVGNGDGTIVIEAVDNELSKNSRGIPNSRAVIQAIRKNQAVAKVYTLRGSVSDYDSLPASAEIGDAYYVTDRNTCYAYSAVGWVDFGNAFATVNGQAPDENGNILISASNIYTAGGISVEDALSALASMPYSCRNFLDNSDFTNPVNQRGFVSGSEVPAYSYFLDRWVTAGETAYPTFGPEGIGGISNDICQRLDLTAYIGKKMTLALYSDYETVISFATGTITNNDGWALIGASPNWECSIISISANRWSCNFRVPCKYVALYEGEFTADTIPVYRPKGYGPELAECQRYFQVFRTESLCPDYCLDFRPTMRMTDTGMVAKYTAAIDGVSCCIATAEL